MASTNFRPPRLPERKLGGCFERLSSRGETKNHGCLSSCHLPAHLSCNGLHFEILRIRRRISAPHVSGLSRDEGGAHFEPGTSRFHCCSHGASAQGAGCSHQDRLPWTPL